MSTIFVYDPGGVTTIVSRASRDPIAALS
ncbi:uncharacterized protein METZ01_LOCUS420169, partial [marine metagenome]